MAQFEVTHEMQAPKGLRLAHFLIDYFAIIALYVILSIAFTLIVIATGGMPSQSYPTTNIALSLLLWFLPYFAYYFVWEALAGRTLGKLITGTIVIHESGEKPTPRTIFIRTLCRFIPFEAFSFLGDTGWHDSISGTCVVKKHIYILRQNEIIELDEIGQNSELL
ncbi:RDD family protein [Flavobacterium sp. MAH-1]|uniref:RDD family protein n=1 Tax=Flavobacterium agri TaxID=2743471 RepID=A0A7Y8Y2U9_9FLAO|nr:RDD family protein [Flavobacterium agri]NUY81550.1 RDD family protein [Flavobacterium agri]NYA71574.1 RDD family protein [Flavobacterium agri]